MKNCALLLVFFCFVGCDRGYPPIIINRYSTLVEISVVFNGGDLRETGIRLPSNTEFIQRRKGLEIEEIHVKEPEGGLRIYRITDFETARSQRKINFEVWILTEEGLKFGDKEDLRELHKGKR